MFATRTLTVILGMFSLVAAARAQTTTQAAVRAWVVQVVPTAESQEAGATAAEHVLIIRDETLRVEGPLGDQFEPGQYEERGVDFRAQMSNEFRGVVLWTGEYREDGTVRGIVRHTQRDGKILTYRFTGTVRQP